MALEKPSFVTCSPPLAPLVPHGGRGSRAMMPELHYCNRGSATAGKRKRLPEPSRKFTAIKILRIFSEQISPCFFHYYSVVIGSLF